MEVGWITDLGFEALEELDRFNRQRDIRRRRELMPHAASIASGRSGAELRLAFDKDDVRDAKSREVIRDTRAHASAADDDDVSGAGHW